jgi:hypothetical protein
MIDGSLEIKLRRADYTLLRYQLRFREDFNLPAYALLRLRRELSRLLNAGLNNAFSHADFRNLLQPALPTDPVLLRRVQQPAPGFVLHIEQLQAMKIRAGELLSLPVCFFGRGMSLVEPFSCLLEALGSVGLCGNRGRFELESIEDGTGSGAGEKLWSGGPFQVAATISDLARQSEGSSASAVRFELMTPARLLRNSRPLFRPSFAELFPFILRRVTGMLAVWADLEDVFDVSRLLECAARLDTSDNRLNWQDWRPLRRHEEAGGLCGSVCLGGSELAELWPLLRIGELCGIGKGAAFGAGRYRLI